MEEVARAAVGGGVEDRKEERRPDPVGEPLLDGADRLPVLTPYHWLAGRASTYPFSIQSFSWLPPMPADEPQAVETVEWQVRLISPIVLEDTLLSSKLKVTLRP